VGPSAVRVAGAAFERAAAMAGGLVATSWLEDLLPRYRAIGDTDAAARVEETIRQRAADSRAEMTTHSATVEIPRKEFDEMAEQICGQSLDEALTRLVGAGLLKYDSMVAQVRNTLEGAPLFAMITINLTGPEGFTEARVGGIEEDEEGRAIHYAGQMVSMQSGMLDQLFQRILQKYRPTAVQIANFIEVCPFFDHARRPLLERGLQAWIERDPVVAAHLLAERARARKDATGRSHHDREF
jgi:hypothetical protein